MEQDFRKKAITLYLEGESPKSIYSKLKRSKEWFFKWLKRYQTGDPDWYKDKSRAPKENLPRLANVTKSESFLFGLVLNHKNLLRSVLQRLNGSCRSQVMDFHPIVRLIEF